MNDKSGVSSNLSTANFARARDALLHADG